MAASPIDIYRRQIERELQAGNATEHTHRPPLKDLIESLAPGVTATNEPKRIACGAPDFNISRNKVPLGHIETKDIGASLDEMERGKGPHGEQFKRYRDGLPNWILTDYLDFRWFVAGEKRLTVRIGALASQGKLRPTPDGEKQLAQLLDAFFKQEALTVGTAKDLAQRMAGMTRIVSDLIIRTFEHEQEKGWLHNWLAAFREVLIPDLDEKQFADMFAQTLAYGLFAAKVHSGSGKTFSREMAAFSLPKTNPFLRKLFSEIAGVDMPETIDWAVDDIVELLKHAEMSEILKDFGKGKGKEDPVVHFYETFLAAYDPKMRELRGVYYTPEPVVSYIVRSIDHLLKTRFSRPKGLADENTLILDPATGTATFLYFVIEQIYEKFAGQSGAWDSYVGSHLLNRIFGFELLMAPYAVAHLKLGMELQQTGYRFASDQRLGIYLTNTLEEAAKKSEQLFANWISEEADAATQIKRDLPIMVVLGNPPYSGHSANRSEIEIPLKPGDSYKVYSRGPLPEQRVTKLKIATKETKVRQKTFIGQLIQDYYSVDGQPLGERNPKWLQDDYVKFIRWSQWRIERTGAGILAFITNHGYLDNPTFRGMRQSLMNLFTDIYILNLHGNSKKKERCPDGSPDENVFDIQQGVTLGIFVKNPVAPASRWLAAGTGAKEKSRQDAGATARVYHADLWGLREAKHEYLFASDTESTLWTSLSPQSPLYLFIPQALDRLAEYERGWQLTDAMPVNVLGFQTHRDPVAIAFDEKSLRIQVSSFLGQTPPDKEWYEYCRPCSYRPFDARKVYLSKSVTDRPRLEVTSHLLRANLAINLVRQTKAEAWKHALASDKPTPAVFLEIKDGSSIFPLHLYPLPAKERSGQTHLGVELSHWPAGEEGRRPNLAPEFIADIEKRLGLKFVPEGSAAVSAASQRDAGATGGVSIRSRGHLPHWEKEGSIYFVTFRLADSLPQSALESIEFERKDIVKTAEQQGRELTPAEQDRLDKLSSERVEGYLDSGQGACHLARAEIANLVAAALQHFEGTRYRLLAWCVMPNHVHVVFRPAPDHRLADILHSWKSFTAKQANKILKTSGEFWQREYYDHLVRDEQDFDRIVHYVMENPARAGLEGWKWVWRSGADVAPASGRPSSQRDAGATGTFGPEDVFNYIYAAFHSPTYRTRYAEFLKSDFPRVPLTSNLNLFRTLCGLGAELVALHLLESPLLANPIARFPVKGSNIVEKGFPKYVAPGEPEPVLVAQGSRSNLAALPRLKEGRVYINKGAVAPVSSPAKGTAMGTSPLQGGQYFEGMPPEVWNFHIGGYQVCEKWLKDRRGRTLTYDDLTHYAKVVTALRETIRLMGEIDAAIPKWPIH